MARLMQSREEISRPASRNLRLQVTQSVSYLYTLKFIIRIIMSYFYCFCFYFFFFLFFFSFCYLICVFCSKKVIKLINLSTLRYSQLFSSYILTYQHIWLFDEALLAMLLTMQFRSLVKYLRLFLKTLFYQNCIHACN